jgi:hypothetical protein
MTSPVSRLQQGSADFFDGPHDESFDEKYNKRLEFPLSLVSAIFVHVLVGAILVFLLVYVMGVASDQSNVPISLVNLDGMDDFGLGSQGSGEAVDEAFKDVGFAEMDPKFKVDTNKLPDVNEVSQPFNPESKLPSPRSNDEELKKLNDKLRNQLAGGKPGSGTQQGSGNSNAQGALPGAQGADSTQARNMRWVLRFKVDSGRDYLEQLKAMGAELLIQIPDTEKCILIADLNKPKEQKQASEEDFKSLAKKVKFSDGRLEAVKAVTKTLGIEDFSPKSFWAFFPKDVEDELSRKELNFRNRRSEDIEETIFSVKIKDGKYELKVEEQKVKK